MTQTVSSFVNDATAINRVNEQMKSKGYSLIFFILDCFFIIFIHLIGNVEVKRNNEIF